MHLLKDVGGSFIFECNYEIKDLSITSIFYRELLQWWSEFRDLFSDEKNWISVVWNHKDIRINGKPVFYRTYYDSGICTVDDLLLNLNNIESFDIIRNKIKGQFSYMDRSQTFNTFRIKNSSVQVHKRESLF